MKKKWLLFALIMVTVLTTIGCSKYRNFEMKQLNVDGKFCYYYGFKKTNSKNLVIFLDGSARDSVLGNLQNSQVGFSYCLQKYEILQTDLLIPERTFFVEPYSQNDKNQLVLEHYTLEDRVRVAQCAIEDYLIDNNYDNIILFGYSEGAIIAGKVYNSLNCKEKITKILLGGNGGLSQYDGFKILQTSEIKMEENYRKKLLQVDEMMMAIDLEPDSISKWWFGWPYRRWSSFIRYAPILDLIKIEIPIVFLQGETDISSPVESARYVNEEFKKAKKTNFVYKEFPSFDHGFNGKIVEIILQEIETMLVK